MVTKREMNNLETMEFHTSQIREFAAQIVSSLAHIRTGIAHERNQKVGDAQVAENARNGILPLPAGLEADIAIRILLDKGSEGVARQAKRHKLPRDTVKRCRMGVYGDADHLARSLGYLDWRSYDKALMANMFSMGATD